MAWAGYGEFAGNEIYNSARVTAYAKQGGAYWFKGCYEDEHLPLMLGDGAKYTTPLLDDAPWVDEDNPASYDFWGAYPIDVTGIEDSNRSSTVVESTLDGGIPGRIRHTTKSVVFSMALLGATECAVEYGMRWLKQALLTGPCNDGQSVAACLGDNFCYLNCAPCMDDNADAVEVGVGDEFLPANVAQMDDLAPWGFNSTFGSHDTAGGTETLSTDFIHSGAYSIKVGTQPTTKGYAYVYGGINTQPVGRRLVFSAWVYIPSGGPDVAAYIPFNALGPLTKVRDQWTQISVPFTTGTSFFVGFHSDPSTTGGSYYVDESSLKISDLEPVDPETCLDPYRRTLKNFSIITGPNVTAKRTMSDGCATMWTVQFTGVAGTPWEYGAEIPVIQGFMDPKVTDPFVSDIEGYYDLDGFVTDDSGCAVTLWDPLVDPQCPALVPPPQPPSIPLGCYTPPANWHRRQITIPAAYVPLWDSVLPTIEIHATTQDVRNLRLRFYADPDDSGGAAIDDNCGFCGDIVFSYIPASHTLIFDGPNERVYVQDPGGHLRRADSLVYATDGTPFQWPLLSCGNGYVVTFDLPQTTTVLPIIDLSLTPRSV